MILNNNLSIFKESQALLSGHFLLSSGLHSPTYFQCAKILQYPHYTNQLCSQLVKALGKIEIDFVISPAVGGIVVGQEVGRLLSKRTIFAERENGKMMLRRGFVIESGEKAVVVEDVITTGGSVGEVIELVAKHRGAVQAIGVLVDRSSINPSFNVPYISTFKMDVVTYQHDSCPLCAEGQPLVKLGSRDLAQ